MKIQRYAVIAILISSSFSLALANDNGTKIEEEQKQIDILKSDAALFDKAAACQRLAIIGTGKSVDILSSLLCDESLSDYARYAMEGIDDASVDQAFHKALDECEGKMRTGVVNSIGVRRDAKATGPLGKLAMDPSSGVSAQALAALGRIANKDAVDTIYKALKSDSQALRLAAGDAALTAAEHLLTLKKSNDALKLYVAIGKADVPKHQHTAALYSEIIALGSDGLSLLIKQLKNDDPAMVAVALRAARELPGSKVTKKLAKQLPKLPANVQVLLIKVLVDRNDPAAVKSIQSLVSSRNANVVAESLKALGRIGDVSTATVLLKAADSEGGEASIARDSLRMLNSEGVDEAIIEHMKKSRPEQKAELIEVLSDKNVTSAVDAVFAETKDKDTKVQRAAFKAIGKLAGPEHIDRVIVSFESIDNDAVGREAEKAVISVAKKIPEESKRADAIIAALKQEKKTEVRCSFIRILAAIADDKSFQVINSSVKDENEQVKDAAVRAITAWPNTEAMSTLLAIFKSTDNKTHRILALRGYIRLLKQDKQTAMAQKAEILGNIIGQVDIAAERKNILSGLASVKHPLALSIVDKYLSDPQVQNEAMLAAIQIAQAIVDTQKDEVKAVALKIEEAASNETVCEQARALLKTIESLEDFITDWQISGPYVKDGQDYSRLFEIPFAPETSDAGVVWSLLPAGTNPDQPWLLDLGKLYPGNHRVAYLRTWVHSSSAQPVRLEIGSDDGIKVWLNGKVVHANNTARAAVRGSDKVDVQLQKGWNKLMLKVTQNIGPWGFCIRLRDSAGNKLKGISIDWAHKEQFTSLFDGKTFTGWEGDLNWFRIEDGAVVAGKLNENIPHNFFLATAKEYYNFELRLKVKTSSPAVNGGIQFRSKRIENHHEVKGYQADIGNGIWGGLYDESRRRRFLVPPQAEVQKTVKNNDWNDYKIRCVNDRIQLFVNGIMTVDYIETDPAIAKQSGIIALQIHGGPPAQAWYKDITIKEIPEQ